jgi:hypothetical protein
MFTRRRDDENGTSLHASSPPSFFARPIQNSIRPPAVRRQEHIQSYLNDAQLAPSTRKVSDGTCICIDK